MSENNIFKRILGEEIDENIGKKVCVLGKVVQVNRVGNIFDVETVDNEMISVRVAQPMEQKTERYVEICGTVDGLKSIVAENHEIVRLPPSIVDDFDKELYVEAMKAMRKHQDAYPIELY